MEEKCYRHLQSRGEIFGMSLFEVFALLAAPIILFPVFTLFKMNFIYIVFFEAILFTIFRMANKVSPFPFGMLSFVAYHMLWPKKLSAFKLKEYDYLVSEKDHL